MGGPFFLRRGLSPGGGKGEEAAQGQRVILGED